MTFYATLPCDILNSYLKLIIFVYIVLHRGCLIVKKELFEISNSLFQRKEVKLVDQSFEAMYGGAATQCRENVYIKKAMGK